MRKSIIAVLQIQSHVYCLQDVTDFHVPRRTGFYNAPFSHGPVIANVTPGDWILTNNQRP